MTEKNRKQKIVREMRDGRHIRKAVNHLADEHQRAETFSFKLWVFTNLLGYLVRQLAQIGSFGRAMSKASDIMKENE